MSLTDGLYALLSCPSSVHHPVSTHSLSSPKPQARLDIWSRTWRRCRLGGPLPSLFTMWHCDHFIILMIFVHFGENLYKYSFTKPLDQLLRNHTDNDLQMSRSQFVHQVMPRFFSYFLIICHIYVFAIFFYLNRWQDSLQTWCRCTFLYHKENWSVERVCSVPTQ